MTCWGRVSSSREITLSISLLRRCRFRSRATVTGEDGAELFLPRGDAPKFWNLVWNGANLAQNVRPGARILCDGKVLPAQRIRSLRRRLNAHRGGRDFRRLITALYSREISQTKTCARITFSEEGPAAAPDYSLFNNGHALGNTANSSPSLTLHRNGVCSAGAKIGTRWKWNRGHKFGAIERSRLTKTIDRPTISLHKKSRMVGARRNSWVGITETPGELTELFCRTTQG